MENSQQLGRLEGAIAGLLDGFNKLKEEKAALQADLAARVQEIDELNETISTLQSEKSVVHDKVDTIIASLESWEKAQTSKIASEGETVAAENPVKTTDNSESQQQIFSMDG